MNESEKLRRFEQLALPHMDAAYNLARWLTGHQQEAEDVVQTAFLRAFRFFESFEGNSARAWLLTIVRNTYFTRLRDDRHERGHVSFDDELYDESGQPFGSLCLFDSAETGPEAMAERSDAKQIINQALKMVAPVYREVLVLKELDGLSYREIAEVVGVPIGTVMSRLARGRALLAQYVMLHAKEQ